MSSTSISFSASYSSYLFLKRLHISLFLYRVALNHVLLENYNLRVISRARALPYDSRKPGNDDRDQIKINQFTHFCQHQSWNYISKYYISPCHICLLRPPIFLLLWLNIHLSGDLYSINTVNLPYISSKSLNLTITHKIYYFDWTWRVPISIFLCLKVQSLVSNVNIAVRMIFQSSFNQTHYTMNLLYTASPIYNKFIHYTISVDRGG